MGITLAVFRIAGKTPVENDKLQIVSRWFDICSWRRCKILVGILLRPQDLLILRDDIILQISCLFVEVILKESLISEDKKFLNDLFENLSFEWTISATEVKKLLKVLAIETGSLMYFSSFVINEGTHYFFASLMLMILYLSKHSLYLWCFHWRSLWNTFL